MELCSLLMRLSSWHKDCHVATLRSMQQVLQALWSFVMSTIPCFTQNAFDTELQQQQTLSCPC